MKYYIQFYQYSDFFLFNIIIITLLCDTAEHESLTSLKLSRLQSQTVLMQTGINVSIWNILLRQGNAGLILQWLTMTYMADLKIPRKYVISAGELRRVKSTMLPLTRNTAAKCTKLIHAWNSLKRNFKMKFKIERLYI